jgi:folate-binding protein YgfZ
MRHVGASACFDGHEAARELGVGVTECAFGIDAEVPRIVHHREEQARAVLPQALRGPVFGTLGKIWPKADWAPRPLRAKTTFLSLAEDGAAGVEAPWRAHRLALGVTEGRAELGDGTTLWLECNAAELNGVSFSKGCYVGQENTARMNWRQKVNRRLVVVPIAEADAKRQVIAYPELGWSVEHRRVEGIDPAKAPAWMHSALLSPGS